jgi:hypothetical protein
MDNLDSHSLFLSLSRTIWKRRATPATSTQHLSSIRTSWYNSLTGVRRQTDMGVHALSMTHKDESSHVNPYTPHKHPTSRHRIG